MARRTRLKTGATLGGEQAEADPLHETAFVETSLYQIIEDRADTRCFVIGRTGSGKSAALQHLEENNPDRVIRISPEDLSLPYITDLQVIKFLDSLDVKLDLFWIALWKHVLLVEVIRQRYKIESVEAKQRFLTSLRDRLKRDPGKQAALQYLEDFEGRFWVEADERVRHITNKFTERIGFSAGASGGAPGTQAKISGQVASESANESRAEQADRYQRIVNETQLARLNKMLSVLNDEILDAAHFTYVVIDDLDRDWVDERISNDLIRCLFRTVLDMQKVQNLKILVALRTNIFQELDFGRSGGQEEKFRALVIEMKWTPDGLEEVLDARVKHLAGKNDLEVDNIRDLLPHANRIRGNPLQYMFDRTLLRPRDAIAYANECLSVAAGKARISWDDIQTAESAYSARRLLALRDEWKPTYPGIERVLENFRGASAKMELNDLIERLDESVLLISDDDFAGTDWLSDLSGRIWQSDQKNAAWAELYQPLVALLYRIGILGCASKQTAAPVFFSTDPLAAASASSLARYQSFHVHRTFHRALDIRRTNENYN